MLAQIHMFQRGDVWYWRRKARGFSTRIIDLQISLRTTNRQRAVMIARRVTAESDDVMEAVKQSQMTIAEAKAFLRAVISRETERLERQRMVIAMDMGPGNPDDDARHDWAHKTALGLFAKHGIRAMVDPAVEAELKHQGVSDRHIETLTLALDQIRQELTGDAGVARRAEMFRVATGRGVSGAVEMLRLFQLQIEGKAAVHAQALAPAAQVMAGEILNEIDPLQIGFSSETPAETDSAPSMSPAPVAPLLVPVPAPTQELEPDTSGIDSSIIAVLERMIEMKKSDDAGLEDKTAQQYRAFGRLLIRATGKEDVRLLKQQDAVQFRHILTKLPKSFGKSPSHHTRPLTDILAEAEALPADKRGMSTATLNRYMDHLGALASWAQDEGIFIDPKLKPGALRRRETRRAREKKRTFTEEELKTFFRHPFFNPGTLPKGKMPKYVTRRASGLYWVPIICAYSGARREEIAGISPSQVKQKDGMWYFEICFEETRRIKNRVSIRNVPVHDDLIKIGFLDYVENARKRKHTVLFPDLKEPAAKILGRKAGRLMEKMVKEIWGTNGKGLSLNSMRHYVQDVLDLDPMVPDKVSRDIVGHEGRCCRKAA
ncbi:MAG: site-specific integrase [Pararhodobacter sp.]